MLQTMLHNYFQIIHHYRDFWQFHAFEHAELPPWPAELIEALCQLSDAEVARIDRCAKQQREFFTPWFAEVFALPAIAAAGRPATAAPPFWLANGIGGRKLEQIRAFLGQVTTSTDDVLEWCAGKGHLGRVLAYQQQRSVISVEWQASLCHAGEDLAKRNQLPQQFVHADVLSEQPLVRQPLAQAGQALALHACGDLHLELMQQAAAVKCPQLYIAPCCYHLTHQPVYQGVSAAAKKLFAQHNHEIDRSLLKLAVQGQVTAGSRISKLRYTEVHWRLAYQSLREKLTGDSTYQPLASVPKHWFSGEFAEFAHWAAKQHQLALPDNCDWHDALAQGAERARVAARIELVRHVFRRPLECFLVLDRAQWLQEHGYQVQIVEFCDYQQTPRNFMLRAQRSNH